MKRNIQHNGVENNVFAEELNWGEAIKGMPTEVDLVLAADCVYFEVSSSLPPSLFPKTCIRHSGPCPL